ncbi:MAG: nicotinamide mononucleotide transporter [Clostridia bacterium]|nr:nicotinamide mononucleotide transporter [Clostridia bacterium]
MANRNLKEDINISQSYSKRLISGKVTATAGVRNPQTLKMTYGIGANRIEVLRALEKQNKYRLIWYLTFFVLGIVCLILEPKSWFYVLDLYILLFNIDLVSEGKLVGVYIGILECFMYAYICFESGLYGEIIKMLAISVPLNIFTIVSWTKNLKEQKKTSYKKPKEENEDKVIIRKLDKKSFWWLGLIFIAIYTACYFGLYFLNTSALILSAGVLALTLFQKVLNALRFKESWWFSIFSNLIATGMWIQVIIESSAVGLNLMELPPLFSTLACLSNAFYGYAIWKSMYRKVAVNGGEVLAIRKVKIKKIIKLRRQYQKLVWDKKIDTEKNS